jgi:ribosome recycling factor
MSEMTDELLADARERMSRSIEATVTQFGTVRTGRANPHLLDRVIVEYYGTQTPLNQMATLAAPEARLLTVTPYDKTSMKSIEKAIRDSDLGLNPSNDGNVMRLSVPELTEERRRDLVKLARQIAEEGRIGIRNVRRDVMQDLRELKNDGDLGADEEKRAEQELQKVTDERVAELDALLKAKEAEILEV